MSSYIAIVITQVLSPYVQKFFSGDTTIASVFIKANPSPTAINITIFALVIILLTTRAGLAGMRGRGLLSPIEVMIYSASTTAIIIASILSFMDESVRANLIEQSRLVSLVMQYYDLVLLAPIVVLVVMGFRRHGRHGELDG